MPTTITIPLTTSTPLFFDEAWPLEELFSETLARPKGPGISQPNNKPKPYTLSPIWRERRRGLSTLETIKTTTYHWRVCLLDEALVPPFLAGLEAAPTLNLNGNSLLAGPVAVKKLAYEQLAQQAQARAKANPQARRHLNLEFVTPVVLRRSGVPMPLPDPVPVFHHYLRCWDTFAPRELWVNVNVLDAIEAHLALIEHQLETRSVKPDGERIKTGFLGRVTYKMMAWQKLGTEFLGVLHMLARFGEFCGTGELTEHGLGQTRLHY